MINNDLKQKGLKLEDFDDREKWWPLIDLGSLQNGHLSNTMTVTNVRSEISNFQML